MLRKSGGRVKRNQCQLLQLINSCLSPIEGDNGISRVVTKPQERIASAERPCIESMEDCPIEGSTTAPKRSIDAHVKNGIDASDQKKERSMDTAATRTMSAYQQQSIQSVKCLDVPILDSMHPRSSAEIDYPTVLPNNLSQLLQRYLGSRRLHHCEHHPLSTSSLAWVFSLNIVTFPSIAW